MMGVVARSLKLFYTGKQLNKVHVEGRPISKGMNMVGWTGGWELQEGRSA
jgi:hypothetical protein